MSKADLFDPIHRQSLSEALYSQLKDRIICGVYRPGDRLPSERVLSEETGINRGAVREAVKRLQQAGLLAVRQGGNHEVLDFLQEAGPELLPSLLVDQHGGFNPKAVMDLMVMRTVLAPEMAFAAAERITPDGVLALEALCADMRERHSDLPGLQHLALAYWQRVVVICDNVAFRLSFNALRKSYIKAWDALTFVLAEEFQDLAGFEAITHAMRSRDPKAAREAAGRHIRLGQRAVDKLFHQETR